MERSRPELGALANLEVLSLSDNQLGGVIPSELGRLVNLEWLNLSENQLSGAIPPELGALANLAGVDLSDNQLHGSDSAPNSPPSPGLKYWTSV